MKKAFKEALDAGQIEVAKLPDGSPFTVDGVQYYQATEEGFNLSIGRFHAFGDTLRRHDELKLSDGLLTTGLSTVTSLLKRIRAQASLDSEQVLDAAQEALVIIDRMEQRRAIGLGVEQVYEIASVFYFGEDEDPGMIDSSINRRKIDSWLKCDKAGVLYCFFLASPIAGYIPLSALSDKSTLSYFRTAINETEILDWTRTLLLLKTSGVNGATMSTIESRRETLYGYDGLLHDVLRSTLTTDQPGNAPS